VYRSTGSVIRPMDVAWNKEEEEGKDTEEGKVGEEQEKKKTNIRHVRRT